MAKNKTAAITGHSDIVEARRFIFEQMVALSKDKITIDVALAQGKLAHQLMEGYKIQVRAMEVLSSGEKDLSKTTIKRLQ